MKTLATLTAASLLVLAGAAAAQTPAPSTAPSSPQTETAPAQGRRSPMTRADFDALTDARMAAIQAGLKLNPEQQRLWAPVEEALRARAASMAERFEERRRLMGERREARGRPEPDSDVTQRLDRQAERATREAQRASEQAQRLNALATAIKPFYASLEENQKRLLPVLMRAGGDRGRRSAMRGHDRRDGSMHHGMGGGMMGHHMDRGRMGRGDSMEHGPQSYH